MKSGQIIPVSTHAQLLNYLLKKDYKQWYKSTYRINDDTYIWIIHLDNTYRDGWKNWTEDDIIIERYDTNKPKTKTFERGLVLKHRLVFEIIGKGVERKYKFHGLYELIMNEDEYSRVLTKESDEYDFSTIALSWWTWILKPNR